MPWRRVAAVLAVVAIAAFAAVIAAYSPSFSPPGLHPRNVEFATASTEVLVDTQGSAITDSASNLGPLGDSAVAYALYLQTDAIRAAIGHAIGLKSESVAASGPFTLLLDRSNVGSQQLSVPGPPTDGRYRLLVDVDGDRPMLTLYAQAPSTHAAIAIVQSARSLLEQRVVSRGSPYPVAEPDRPVVRSLGTITSGVVDPGARVQLMAFVFVLVALTCGILLQAYMRRRAPRASLLGWDHRRGVDRIDAPSPGRDDWPHTTRLLPWALAVFMAMLFLVPFDSAQLPVHLPLDSNLDRPILIAVAMLWLWSLAAMTGVARPRLKLTWIHVTLLLFFAVCCASLVVNGDALVTMGDLSLSVKKLALLMSYIVFFYVVASVVRPREVPRYATLMVCLGVVVAVAAVAEYRFHYNPFYTLWSSVLKVTYPSDLDVRDSIGRIGVYGPTGNPLELAALLAMVLPFALIGFFDSPTRSRRVLYGLAVGILVAGGLATSRKTSLVAPAGAMLVLIVYRPRAAGRKLLALAVPLFVVVHVVSPGALGSVINQLEPGRVNNVLTTTDRTARYDAVRPDVMSHLLVGRGFQSYDPHKYRILDNQYLQIVIGVGAIGLALYLAIFIVMMVTAHPTIRGPDPKRAGLALASTAAVFVIVISNALFDVVSFPHVPYLLFFIGGMIVALREPSPSAQLERGDREPGRSVPSRVPPFDPAWPVVARIHSSGRVPAMGAGLSAKSRRPVP